MKKSLLALAVLGAFAGAAQAQTSVTVYGSIDGGIRHQSNTNAAGDNNTTMGDTYQSNRIGFKGVEDLGSGLNAHFTLEGGFKTGTGAIDSNGALFHRTALVGLGGSWGSLDLGQQYSVSYKVNGLYDPFRHHFTSITPVTSLAGNLRSSNDIQYTGKFGPVKVLAEYALGEVAGSSSQGSTTAIGGTYVGGPFSIGGAYTSGKRTATGGAGGDLDMKDWTIGGAYATGPFRVAAGYNDNKQDTAATTEAKTKDWWLGGSYVLSPAAALTAGYYETKATSDANLERKRKLFMVGATYAVSKRTNFYADIDSTRYDGDASVTGTVSKRAGKANDNQTGFSVGVNHLF